MWRSTHIQVRLHYLMIFTVTSLLVVVFSNTTTSSSPSTLFFVPQNSTAAHKGMEPAAGEFTDTRDSRPLQDGIKERLKDWFSLVLFIAIITMLPAVITMLAV